MANDVKNALLAVKTGEAVQKLFLQTTAHNVIVDKATGETLKQRLAKIANQLGSTDLSVTEQIDQIKSDLAYMLENADSEAIDSIKEIGQWITEHSEEFESLSLLARGLEATLKDYADEVSAQALEDAKAYADEVSAQVLEDAKAYTDEKVQAEEDRALEAEADLAKAIEDSLVIFESATEFDPEKVKMFGCILLDDEPEEVETAEQLASALLDAESTAPVVLQGNIVVTPELAEVLANLPDGKVIDLNGFTLEG